MNFRSIQSFFVSKKPREYVPIEDLLKGVFFEGEGGSGDKEGEIRSDFSVFAVGAS